MGASLKTPKWHNDFKALSILLTGALGRPFGIFNIQSVAKYQKKLRGTIWSKGLKTFRKSHSAKNRKGIGPFSRPKEELLCLVPWVKWYNLGP